VHHGIPVGDYAFSAQKDGYVAFLGRMAPCKGPHLAIEAARRAGIHLKLAGEVQPIFRDYWEQQVRPLIDGRLIEYVGEVDCHQKNELLSRARSRDDRGEGVRHAGARAAGRRRGRGGPRRRQRLDLPRHG
jgi:glycosyltransferase involved in cell wall biosynthesis